MEKNYEKYAAQVAGCNSLYQEEVKKKADDLNKLNADWRWSPKGKQEKKQAIFDEIQKSADNMSGLVKEACKHFLAEYAIKLPEDGKDHAIDIQNALHIIDMFGTDLDVRNLNNLLTPLKGSFRNLKIIVDVIRTRDETAFAKRYSPDVMRVIDEHTGLNTSVYEYLDFIENIQEIIDNPAGYGFEGETISNAPVVYIRETTPYSFMACPDWMKQAGMMYEALEDELNKVFTVHIPTDQEMLEDIMK